MYAKYWNGYDEVIAEDSLQVEVVKVEIEHSAAPGRDTDDIQVQYFTNVNGSGDFEYTAIPLQIYYKIEPASGWTPDSVKLKIWNPGGSVIRTIDLPVALGQQKTTWGSKDEAGDYVPFGKGYTAQLEVKVESVTCTAEHTFDRIGISPTR